MSKILIFILSTTAIFASYNPFFEEIKAPQKQIKVFKQTKKNIVYKPRPTRKNIVITYFGFIHSDKGKFALVNFQNKNIVIKKNDSLYIDEQIFKIKKITSNYILINDRYNRPQSIYFSSQTDRGN